MMVKMISKRAVEKAAQAWTKSTTKHINMDPVLAQAFAAILDNETDWFFMVGLLVGIFFTAAGVFLLQVLQVLP